MWRLLRDHGIKPWELGELTYPWIGVILRRGKPAELAMDAVERLKLRDAMALAAQERERERLKDPDGKARGSVR